MEILGNGEETEASCREASCIFCILHLCKKSSQIQYLFFLRIRAVGGREKRLTSRRDGNFGERGGNRGVLQGKGLYLFSSTSLYKRLVKYNTSFFFGLWQLVGGRKERLTSRRYGNFGKRGGNRGVLQGNVLYLFVFHIFVKTSSQI